MTKLKDYIQNIEHVESQKEELNEQIKAIYLQAKSEGFDPAIMKKLIAIRKKDINELQEEEQLLETYKQELGM